MKERHMSFRFYQNKISINKKLRHINYVFIFLIMTVCSVGFMTLYSVENGNIDPLVSNQILRFFVGFIMMLIIATIDINFWIRWAYVIYGITILLLITVEITGSVNMGAQRWINLKFIQLQPSEIMKIALVLALARYFHWLNCYNVKRSLYLIPPLTMIIAPVILVFNQPDFGTAIVLTMTGGVIFFLVGVQIWKFITIIAFGLAAIPIIWNLMHKYQRQRIITFLDSESDITGSGYHIMQSKIAFGSGHIFGKGFLLGTQNHLNFLPEKQTDFIFTTFAEEWGIIGSTVLLLLYTMIIFYSYKMSLQACSQFARLIGLGLITSFFLYVFINIAMVTGLIPVVGIPLPLISYGGTSMITTLFAFGLILSVYIHRNVYISNNI
ncbi:MAG: rod shape-determining protein RodA [Rhodospirillaceae bacterium]|jgi:rod shape determining protein RodA|nr:rod shape-determining protein RodA [Rhodospirillaceae bacterium]